MVDKSLPCTHLEKYWSLKSSRMHWAEARMDSQSEEMDRRPRCITTTAICVENRKLAVWKNQL